MKNNNSELIKYTLLYIIHNKAKLEKLIYLGLDYEEIYNLIKGLIKDEIVTLKNEKLSLSNYKGISLFNDLEKQYKEKNKNKWIDEDDSVKIIKISKNDIYLPSRETIDSLKYEE